jgi:hypothetical protein
MERGPGASGVHTTQRKKESRSGKRLTCQQYYQLATSRGGTATQGFSLVSRWLRGQRGGVAHGQGLMPGTAQAMFCLKVEGFWPVP